jgi:predicted dehydrogenase
MARVVFIGGFSCARQARFVAACRFPAPVERCLPGLFQLHSQPDPLQLAERPIRWAIAGTGPVAAKFATQLRTIRDARLHAVVSASPENAVRFTQAHGGRPCERLVDALTDPLVDIVYIATPTRSHAEHARLALTAGKAVLCEKPFAGSTTEAAQIVQLARQRQRFCMEAMWMRFNPVVQETKRLLQQGCIGAVRTAHITTGYLREESLAAGADPARGAMLRFGCYGVSLAHFLFGNPRRVASQVHALNSGVDETASALLDYDGTTVNLTAGVGTTLANEAVFCGERGRLVISSPWFNPTALTSTLSPGRMPQPGAPRANSGEGRLSRLFRRASARLAASPTAESVTLVRNPAYRDSGLRLEAVEAMRCLRAGLAESPLMPLEESLAVHRTIDIILNPDRVHALTGVFAP